jgi:hypothetical protein
VACQPGSRARSRPISLSARAELFRRNAVARDSRVRRPSLRRRLEHAAGYVANERSATSQRAASLQGASVRGRVSMTASTSCAASRRKSAAMEQRYRSLEARRSATAKRFEARPCVSSASACNDPSHSSLLPLRKNLSISNPPLHKQTPQPQKTTPKQKPPHTNPPPPPRHRTSPHATSSPPPLPPPVSNTRAQASPQSRTWGPVGHGEAIEARAVCLVWRG